MKIHESTDASGDVSVMSLRYEGGVLAVVECEAAYALPEGALEAVMKRFAAPLDPSVRVTTIAELDVGEGRVLRHVRHLAGWDVVARDYLVYAAPGSEPLCALATTVAGALGHLARAAATRAGHQG